MSFRNIALILFGALGACSLFTACTYQLPADSNGVGGNGGGGNGVGGAAGAASTSGSAGAAGMGGNAGAGGMPADWWDSAWAHRVKITFQNANSEALTDFPVMVRLDQNSIAASHTSLDGADLRFVDADGQTILKHEIDSWSPSSNSFVWVRVPTIDASDNDYIWLYYGNPNATDEQKPAEVWNDFIGVYHLSPSFKSSTKFADSTGTIAGAWDNELSPGQIVEGPINQAIDLDGNHFVHIGDNGKVAANPGQARTVEAWAKTSQMLNQAIVYEEGECLGWYLGMNASGDALGSFITDAIDPPCQEGIVERLVTANASAGMWHYLTLVVDRPGLEMRLFVDGIHVGSTDIDNTARADGNGVFRIGSDHDGGMGSFVGTIDEVRVSNNARSAGWIAAQHKSMTDNFLNFTVE